MTSDDDVHRLRREGFSIRAIADRLGLSRMKVHRTLTADLPEDDDEDEPALFDPEPVLVEPFTFCGVEAVLITDRHDDPRAATEERWLDSNGRSVSVLDIYRYCAHRAGDYGDYETTRPASGWAPTWTASAPRGVDSPRTITPARAGTRE